MHLAGHLLTALGLLAAPLLPTSAFAEREAGSFGGRGGAPFHGTCSPKALAGVFLRAGKAVDSVGISCGTLNKNGTVTDVIGDVRFHAGGSGGDPLGSFGQFCPKNALVTGMKVWMDYDSMVNGFILRCTSMIDGSKTWTTMQTNREYYDNPHTFLCKKDEIGSGIYGRAGSLIDNLGLLCADNPMLVAAESPAPPPAVPEKPIKKTGRGGSGNGSSSASASVLSCQGGGAMKVTISSQTAVFIAFTPASQAAETAKPGAGECAWPDRPFAANEAHRFALDPSKPNAQLMFDAVRAGGTFQMTAAPIGDFIMVKSIDNVQVVDSTPLSPGPAAGEDQAGGGAEASGSPTTPADGSCGSPGATATVVISEPNLAKLNVRAGPGGQVIGTVAEGATVTLAGPCGSEAAAGFAKPAKSKGGAAGWCQLDQPIAGCVMAKYLDFSGGGAAGFAKSAAGFAKPKGEQQVSASATADFSGRWTANADNVAYSLSLKQNGNGISGSYQGDDGSAGKINGQMNGNVLRFAWVQKDGTRGSGKFVLSGDGRSFDGSYNFGSNPDAVEGSWNGARQ